MTNDSIGEALSLTPIEIEEEVKVIKPKNDDKLDADYEYSRLNLYSVIEQGTKALEEIGDVARASEHPRAYEVVGTIMKTLVDANKELLELAKKKNEIEFKKAKQDEDLPNTVNNNLFVGSTSELQKMLENMRK